jgi:LysM repeat protein
MAARRPSRYLAPIALLAAAAAITLVVKDHVNSHSSASTTSTNTGSLVQSTRRVQPRSHRPAHKFYTVRSGDTLSGISQKTGVSVQAIERLNQGLNPSALQTGQRLRLRR